MKLEQWRWTMSVLALLAAGAAHAFTGWVATTCPVDAPCTLPSAVALLDLQGARQTGSTTLPRGALGQALSADGTRLFVTHADPPALSQIDAAGGQLLSTVALSFTPNLITLRTDGALAWISGGPGLVAVLPGSGAVVATVALPAPARAQRLSPDGQRLYMALADGHLAVIDTATTRLAQLVATPSPLPYALAVSADGATLWMGGYVNDFSSGVLVFSTADLALRATLVTGGQYPAVALVGNSVYVLVNQQVQQFDAVTLAPLATIPLPSDGFALVPRAGGELLIPVAGSVLRLATGTNTLRPAIPTQSTAGDLVVTADGRRGFGALRTDAVSLVDPLTHGTRTTLPVGPRPTVVAVSADGTRGIAGGRRDIGVTLFATAGPAFVAAGAPPQPAAGVAISPDGHRAYVATAPPSFGNGVLSVLDGQTGVLVRNIPLPGIGTSQAVAEALALTPDGSKAYVSVALIPFEVPSPIPGYLLVVDTRTLAVRRVLANAGGAGLAMAADGRTLYAMGAARIFVVDTATDRVQRKLPASGVTLLALSPDGRTLWTGAPLDHQIRVLDAASGQVQATLPFADLLADLAFTPEGARVWVTGADGSVTVFDAATRSVVDALPLPGVGAGIGFQR